MSRTDDDSLALHSEGTDISLEEDFQEVSDCVQALCDVLAVAEVTARPAKVSREDHPAARPHVHILESPCSLRHAPYRPGIVDCLYAASPTNMIQLSRTKTRLGHMSEPIGTQNAHYHTVLSSKSALKHLTLYKHDQQ